MKVDKIRKIAKLKRVMQRWKHHSLRRRFSEADSSGSGSHRRVQSGFLAVYVGHERRRFVIPTRFLKLRVFSGLLSEAAEEYGFPCDGGLVLPCDAVFFQKVIRLLERDEPRFGRFGLEEFFRFVESESGIGFGSESSCKQATATEPLLEEAWFEYHRVTIF